MAYPQSFIEELKQRNDIEQVIGKYVDLKRAGSNLTGRCPFHSERTPSFTVFPEKNFYCFGCGAGGDVITFVMRIENVDYPTAVGQLADRAGIAVPQQQSYTGRIQEKEVLSRERNFEMNKAAARLFHKNLMSPEGADALSYLTSRGLSMATIRHFGLGFAKNSFDDLYSHLSGLGFNFEEIKAAFLCGISKNGKPYDYFRNRVIFPIIDLSGNVIAFGGRVMDDSKPKYLNTSDTPVFKKSRNLFALNFARNSATSADNNSPDRAKSGELILCEGYMDVIALHQAGFTGAVATLGTALTPEQARIMSRYAKTLYVSYDSDAAGKRADEKAIKLLGEVGVEVKILKVTGGAKDPDEYIKKYGAESFRKLMGGASGQIDYRLGEIINKYNLDIPDEKLSMLNESCTLIATVYPELRREVYITRLSELTGISKDAIAIETKRRTGYQRAAQKKEIMKESENSLRHYGDRINPDAVKYSKAAETEEHILGILLLYPEYLKGGELCEEDFLTEFNKNVFVALKGKISLQDAGYFDISLLGDSFSPEQVGRIFGMYHRRRALTVNDKKTFLELVAALKKERERLESRKASDMTPEELARFFEKKRKNKQ